jgi:hypothetical protein
MTNAKLDLFRTGGNSPPHVPTVLPRTPDTFSPTTPEKRKRDKCMSRRSQVGSIESSGKWYVLRFWKDVPGQEKRIHASERVLSAPVQKSP